MKLYFPADDIQKLKLDVEKILSSGMLTLHTYTREFEKQFASICQVEHAVAVNSGTSALEIALRALGLKSGDQVLVPTNTFSATAAPVLFAGGKPVFTDIDPNTLCIDSENVQRYMTRKTKGLIIVHIGGLICPEIEAIRKLCQDHKMFLIEDAAHAEGSTIYGQPAGSLGDVGCFSFYPTKVITSGEGGMITTDNVQLAEKAHILRDQGKKDFNSNIIVELGFNWRLPEVSAAIGLLQLQRLPEIIAKRNRIADIYNKEFTKMEGLKLLRMPSKTVSNYYKYVVVLDSNINRDEFKKKLKEKGVNCSGEVYWPPLHLQPIYRRLLHTKEGDFPIAEQVCSQMICLPMYTQMTKDEAKYVVEKVEETVSELWRK